MLEARKLLALLLVCAVPSVPDVAAAQLLPTFDDYAAAIVSGMRGRWAGQRVPWPTEASRPAVTASLADDRLPLWVHASEGDGASLEIALRGARAMRAHLERTGWTRLPRDSFGPDGGFDLYLVPGIATWEARSDGPVRPAILDTVTAHAVLSRELPPSRLEACAAEAYAGAVLLSLDPAESASWRRATAEYLLYTMTGELDACSGNVGLAQLTPGRTWIGEDGAQTGGALLLAMLADRHDGGGGAFVRELWNMARQWTWEGEGLRGSPDLWEALARAIELSGLVFADTMIDASIARAIPSVLESTRNAELPTIRALVRDDGAYIADGRVLADLPAHLPVSRLVEPLGATYAHLDVRGARVGTRVRIWMRGDIATRWSLAVVGFDAVGREVSRVRSPITEREDHAYVPFELEPRVTQLLVVVTNIAEHTPDSDLADEAPRACRLVLDLAAPGTTTGPL